VFHVGIIPVIEKAGGLCVANAPVTKILFEGDKAVGVHVKSKTCEMDLFAKDAIVSAAGMRVTFEKLVNLDDFPSNRYAKYKMRVGKVLNEVPPSSQHVQVFIGMFPFVRFNLDL